MYMSAEERRLRLDDGHHAPPARRRERADDRQPGPAARHGRPAQRRPAADPRPQQRAGHRLGRRRRRSSSRRSSTRFEAAPRRSSCRRRRASTRWPAWRRPTEARCGPPSAWAATSSAAIPMRRSPRRRSASSSSIAYLSTTLNTGHAWGTAARDAHPAGAAPRRRAAADDAGIDVQLRAPQRRRSRALPGTAQRGVGARRARPPRAGRRRSRGLERPREPPANPRADRRADSRLANRWPTSTARAASSTSPAVVLNGPQFPDAVRQGAVPRDRDCPCTPPTARARAATDDGALRRAVQHRRLRRGRHLPRAGTARRDPDQPGRHRSAWG